MRFLIY